MSWTDQQRDRHGAAWTKFMEAHLRDLIRKGGSLSMRPPSTKRDKWSNSLTLPNSERPLHFNVVPASLMKDLKKRLADSGINFNKKNAMKAMKQALLKGDLRMPPSGSAKRRPDPSKAAGRSVYRKLYPSDGDEREDTVTEEEASDSEEHIGARSHLPRKANPAGKATASVMTDDEEELGGGRAAERNTWLQAAEGTYKDANDWGEDSDDDDDDDDATSAGSDDTDDDEDIEAVGTDSDEYAGGAFHAAAGAGGKARTPAVSRRNEEDRGRPSKRRALEASPFEREEQLARVKPANASSPATPAMLAQMEHLKHSLDASLASMERRLGARLERLERKSG